MLRFYFVGFILMTILTPILVAFSLQGKSSVSTLEYWSQFPNTINGSSARFILTCRKNIDKSYYNR